MEIFYQKMALLSINFNMLNCMKFQSKFVYIVYIMKATDYISVA